MSLDRTSGSQPPRRIVIVTFPGLQPLDVVGPAEVFAGASDLAATWVDGQATDPAYEVEVVAESREPVFGRTRGYSIVPATSIDDHRGSIDTLIVAGLQDGIFPTRSRRALFLGGALRERLDLPGWTDGLARDAELFTRLLHAALDRPALLASAGFADSVVALIVGCLQGSAGPATP